VGEGSGGVSAGEGGVYFEVRVAGDSPYMYVGVAYEGVPVHEAYSDMAVVWRKGTGEVAPHPSPKWGALCWSS
jgi:hypothetical protein